MPIEINCNPVNFEDEIALAGEDGLSVYNREHLTDNLKYLREIGAPIFNHPDNKVKFVYYFEYKGGACKISALTFKVFFIGKPDKRWKQYSAGDRLEDVLFDRESKCMEEKLASKVCKIDLITCNSLADRVTEKQFYFAVSLLQKAGKSFMPRALELMTKQTAHLIIEALLRGNLVHFTDNIADEFSEEEMNIYLDAVTEGKVN